GSPAPSYTWYKDTEELTGSDAMGRVFRIEIANPTDNHDGAYECSVSNEFGTNFALSRLSFISPPNVPDSSTNVGEILDDGSVVSVNQMTNVTVQAGTDFCVMCEPSLGSPPAEEIVWRRNSLEGTEHEGIDISDVCITIQDNGTRLCFTDVSRAYSDVYSCFVANEAGSDSGNITIQVSVQLWSVSNYHWYLKQEIQSPKTTPTDETTPTHYTGVVWDPIVPLRLHTLLNNGQYIQYNWKRGVVTSTSLNVNNNSTVAVIDGEALLLTPFRDVIVPLPMSHKRLVFPSPVVMATFAPPPTPNDLLIVLSDGSVYVAKSGTKMEYTLTNLRFPCMEGDDFSIHKLRQIVWAADGLLVGVVNKSCDE
uniref:Ig-like domain-containing protein n=1 Tax=Amphimedon queenslandica TaxID=400682 RepID=A0A1X7T8A1_AMPQE